MTAAVLRPDRLQVGEVATGTAMAHHGPVVHRDVFGCGNAWCCIEFADHVEVTVTADTAWTVGGTP